MKNNKHFELIRKAYEFTENTAPLRFDCGTLCGAVCCKNLSASEFASGMCLLPYEKEYLESVGAKNFIYQHTDDGDFLQCNGKCDRAHRPFSCRIFPYYASVHGNNIKIKKDLRAAAVCPLLFIQKHKRANIFFIRSIKRAVRLLISEDIYRTDFEKTADFIESLYELYSKLK